MRIGTAIRRCLLRGVFFMVLVAKKNVAPDLDEDRSKLTSRCPAVTSTVSSERALYRAAARSVEQGSRFFSLRLRRPLFPSSPVLKPDDFVRRADPISFQKRIQIA